MRGPGEPVQRHYVLPLAGSAIRAPVDHFAFFICSSCSLFSASR
jgi:hypothetical protein